MTEAMLRGAPNFRDIGGYRTKDGHVVRSGLVFRSGHLANLTTEDIETVSILKIRTVVDFRPDRERELSGQDVVLDNVNYISIPIGDPAMAPHVYRALRHGEFSALPDLAVANRTLVRDFSAQLSEALRLISDPKNLPLVFHCIGGKDRTGITSAFLLSILGVDWPSVQEDYLRSNGRLGATLEDQNEFLAGLTKRAGAKTLTDENRLALRRFFVLEESYLDAAWDEIGRVADSFEDYMQQHLSLDDAVTSRLRSLLLEVDPATPV